MSGYIAVGCLSLVLGAVLGEAFDGEDWLGIVTIIAFLVGLVALGAWVF